MMKMKMTRTLLARTSVWYINQRLFKKSLHKNKYIVFHIPKIRKHLILSYSSLKEYNILAGGGCQDKESLGDL